MPLDTLLIWKLKRKSATNESLMRLKGCTQQRFNANY
jgi:hypothetical protein